VATDFERYEAELKKKKKWLGVFGFLLLAFVGLWFLMGNQVKAKKSQVTAQDLTREEVQSFRRTYANLYNEMLSILQDAHFYETGFGKGYPKGHAWAAKVEALSKRYGNRGVGLIRATYNPLTESPLLPGELRQIASEIHDNQTISPLAKRQLAQIEYNIRMGDTRDIMGAKLPGVEKYRGYMVYQGTSWSDSYSHPDLPEQVSVMWLNLGVPQNDTHIPAEYRANGHTLRVGIISDGSAIVLQKTPTQAVFLDRTIDRRGQDMVIPIP